MQHSRPLEFKCLVHNFEWVWSNEKTFNWIRSHSWLYFWCAAYLIKLYDKTFMEVWETGREVHSFSLEKGGSCDRTGVVSCGQLAEFYVAKLEFAGNSVCAMQDLVWHQIVARAHDAQHEVRWCNYNNNNLFAQIVGIMKMFNKYNDPLLSTLN